MKVQSDFKRNTRIVAPVPMVWDEIASLEDILAKTPQLMNYQLAADGTSAQVEAKLSWGPIKFAVDGTAVIDESKPRECTRYVVTIPQLGLRYAGTMRITPGDAKETTLDYDGGLEIDHKLAGRMRGLFSELLEEHIHGLTMRVKTRAEQRRQADERLLT